MERHTGLSRDPFAPSTDGTLFWESDERAELRRRVASLLHDGHGVRVDGKPDSGRRTLLTRVAGDLAADGVPVALLDEPVPGGPEEFLAGLATTVGAEPPAGADLLTLAEHLYRRLVDVFCAARPAVVVLPWAPSGAVAEEVSILSELRLLGRPLLAAAVLDSPDLPSELFDPISVTSLTPDELRDCLSHRCAASGRPDLLSPTELEACVLGASGIPTALRRARMTLRSRVFASTLDALDMPAAEPRAAVLDPTQVQEVTALLDSFSPDPL